VGGPLTVRAKRGRVVVVRGVVCALILAIMPGGASAQSDRPGAAQRPPPPATGLAERLPSTVDVSIPFTVGPASCTDRSRAHVVSMRIYNVLAQLVAVPLLRADSGAEPPPPGLAGRPLNKLLLPCGRYLAYWNGRQGMSGRRLPAGVYLYELVVDDQRVAGKLTLGK
jgi:hypothetical protein